VQSLGAVRGDVDVFAEEHAAHLVAGDRVRFDDSVSLLKSDREELWERLAAGEIDMINADHAPSTREQKAAGEDNVFDAPFRIPGVETVLPLMLNGVADGKVSLERVVEVFATNPAKILDLHPRKGSLQVGADANLTVVDLDRERTLRDEDVVAKCGWTPFDGPRITGGVDATFVRGEPVYRDGKVVGDPGYGEFVRRGENR